MNSAAKAFALGGASSVLFRILNPDSSRRMVCGVFLASAVPVGCMSYYNELRQRQHAAALARMSSKTTAEVFSMVGEASVDFIDAKHFDAATGVSGEAEVERLMKEELTTKVKRDKTTQKSST